MPSDHDDQCARDPFADPAGEDEDPQRNGTDHDRRTVGVAETAHDVDRFADGAVFVAREADQLADLAEDQHDGNPRDVADQDRLGEVVGDPPQPGEACDEEHQSHQQGEHRCQRGVLGAPGGGERSERRRDQQRDRALRSDHHPRRRPEHGVRHNGQQQGVETSADRNTRQLRKGHRRREGQRGHRDAGDEIGPQTRARE